MKTTLFAAAAALLLSACQTASEGAPQAQPAVEQIEIIKEVQVETTPNLFILYTLKEGVKALLFVRLIYRLLHYAQAPLREPAQAQLAH